MGPAISSPSRRDSGPLIGSHTIYDYDGVDGAIFVISSVWTGNQVIIGDMLSGQDGDHKGRKSCSVDRESGKLEVTRVDDHKEQYYRITGCFPRLLLGWDRRAKRLLALDPEFSVAVSKAV